MGEGAVSGEINKSFVCVKSVLSQGTRAPEPGGTRVSTRKGDPEDSAVPLRLEQEVKHRGL